MFFERYSKREPKEIFLLDIFILFISIISIVNVVLLASGYFYALLSLIISFVIFILFLFLFKVKIVLRDNRFNWLFLFIILIGLLFRLTPNLYLTGGQDQGTYVSLSKQYEINHSLYIKDELRELLTTEQKIIYDKSISAELVGVEVKNLDKSTYVMPFYPVFPSWMSIFGSLFGSDNRVYAMTMFSILSIIGIYLFSYEISGKNKKVGLLTSFLLAINPLHVYFSRVPITEIVSLCFMLFSFYYLLRSYYEYKEGKQDLIIGLAFSLISINALFYTRMNGILYLPFIVILPILIFLFLKDKYLLKIFLIYVLCWILLFLISFGFYYLYLPELFNSILQGRIVNLFGLNNLIYIGSFSLLLFLLFIFTHLGRKILKTILGFISRYIYIIAIVIFFTLIFYEGFFYVKDILITNRYDLLSKESLSYLKQLSFLATFLYLSPIGFLLLPISFYYGRKNFNVPVKLGIAFIIFSLIYCWGVLKMTPYHYYFVRYQLSELIPFCIILISFFCVKVFKSGILKYILIFSLVLSSSYFLYFSYLQTRNYEGLKKEALEDVRDIVGKENILIISRADFVSVNQILLPIKYYYGVHTFNIRSLTYLQKSEVLELKKKYQTVYLLSTNPDLERGTLELVKEIDFYNNYFVHCNRSEDKYFEMISHSEDIPFCEYIVIPNRYYEGVYKIYLYKWNRK